MIRITRLRPYFLYRIANVYANDVEDLATYYYCLESWEVGQLMGGN